MQPEVKIKWILFSIILIRCIFLAVPPDHYIYPFLFKPEIGIPTISYVWMLAEHFAIISLCYLWWRDSKRKTALIFLFVLAFDSLDFLLRSNTPYRYDFGYPITNNVIALTVFGLLTLFLDETEKTGD